MTLSKIHDIGQDARVFVKLETGTYPAIATPLSTDAVKFTSCKIAVEQEHKHAPEFRQNRSRNTSERYDGRRRAMWEIQQEARGGGTGGSAPDCVDLLTDLFGAAVTNTETDVTAVTSASVFDVTTPGNLAEKTFVAKKNENGDIEARFITDITASAVTVTPAFSEIPVVGDEILASYNLTLAAQTLTSSLTIYAKTTTGAIFAKGCKVTTLKIAFDGDSTKLTWGGEGADHGYTFQDELLWPMKADYAFSQNGPTGDPSLIDATHKTFKLSVAADTAEDCTLAGTEATWLAVVTYLNATAIPALLNPNNAAAVAELIGTGNGTGMYIRPATTGSSKDVEITAGSSNDCSVVLELGTATGGYELDANEAKVDDLYKHSVDAHFTIGTETMIITSIDYDDAIIRLSRAEASTSAADHEIDDDINPYAPTGDTFVDVQPISGIAGGVFLNDDIDNCYVLTAEINIDEKTKLFGDQLGKETADGHARVSEREVTETTQLYATNMSLWMVGVAREDASITAIYQAGKVAGNIWAAYNPVVKVNNPDYDPGQDEENVIDFEIDALSATAAGGDEIYIGIL